MRYGMSTSVTLSRCFMGRKWSAGHAKGSAVSAPCVAEHPSQQNTGHCCVNNKYVTRRRHVRVAHSETHGSARHQRIAAVQTCVVTAVQIDYVVIDW